MRFKNSIHNKLNEIQIAEEIDEEKLNEARKDGTQWYNIICLIKLKRTKNGLIPTQISTKSDENVN